EGQYPRRRDVVQRVRVARLAAAEDVVGASGELGRGVVPQIQTEDREPQVAAHLAARADQAAVGRVVVTCDQAAEAIVLHAHVGVARDDDGGGTLVADAGLLETVERAFDLPDGAGLRAELDGARETEARAAVGDASARLVGRAPAPRGDALDLG